MKKSIRTVISGAFLVSFLSLTCFFVNDVAALDPIPAYKITMAPAVDEVSVRPGETIEKRITVANQGSKPFKLNIEVVPYSVEGLQYSPVYKQLPGGVNAANWVRLSESSGAQLDTKRIQDIHYTVSPPPNTKPGGYYAVLFAEAVPLEPGGQGVTVRTRVGVVLYITVEGEIQRTGDVSGKSIPLLSTGSEADASVDVKNTGGLHFRSKVDIAVRDIFGRIVWQESQDRYVLPGTERLFSFKWQPGVLLGVYKISREATVFGVTRVIPDAWTVVVSPFVALSGLMLLVGLVIYHVKKRTQR